MNWLAGKRAGQGVAVRVDVDRGVGKLLWIRSNSSSSSLRGTLSLPSRSLACPFVAASFLFQPFFRFRSHFTLLFTHLSVFLCLVWDWCKSWICGWLFSLSDRQLLPLLCLGPMNQPIDWPESLSKKAWYDEGWTSKRQTIQELFSFVFNHLVSSCFTLYWYSGCVDWLYYLYIFAENVKSYNWSQGWEVCLSTSLQFWLISAASMAPCSSTTFFERFFKSPVCMNQ